MKNKQERTRTWGVERITLERFTRETQTRFWGWEQRRSSLVMDAKENHTKVDRTVIRCETSSRNATCEIS